MKKKRVLFVVLLVILPLLLIVNPIVQADSPIQIDSIDDLWNIRNDLSGYYILMNDLDFDNNDHYIDWTVSKNENTTGDGWLPIGNISNELTGTFDGQNYTISNLFIDRDDDDGIGLFGYTLDSTIININLIDVDVTGYEFVGGLIGFNIGNISNCSITGSLNGYYYVGGLVGYNLESFIADSYTAVQVIGENCVGGLTGSNIDSSVDNSYANGDISGLTDYDNNIGGLIGYNSGIIANCYATGDVVSEGKYSWYIGGLVGENDEGSIANCYSTGYVDGNDVVGGLIGSNTGMVENCFWDRQTSGQDSSDGGTGKTTSEMKNFNTFDTAGWDIAKIEDYDDETWFINHTFDYPRLGWESTSTPNNPPNIPSCLSPINHATNITINAILSWSCADPDGDSLTFDVYFGTSSNPPMVISNQSGTTYNPGTLNYNTKYYWKIVAWDNHGASAIGPIWDFTTKVNNPPNLPRNPDPSNHAISIDINADLSWTGGDPDAGDTVTYDVYFGTSSNPLIVSHNQTATSFEPETMNYNTQYYWKITAWDNNGAKTVGPIWDFTSGNEPNNPPNIPSDPNPVNHAAGIDINADLNWTGGDPDSGDTVTYDIYLGTASDPPLHKSNHPSTSYDPGTMSSNTTYYWKIVSKDNHGASITGPVWDFTTVYVKQPPNTPYNPTPLNGTTSINIDQDLYWSGGDPNSGDTVTYDVYFGTSSNPLIVSHNQTATSFEPGTMNQNTKYYWKIIAWDNYGEYSTGPIWSFTTIHSQGGNGGDGGDGGAVLPPNKVPIADASASDNSGFVNTSVTFNGSYSYDEDGEITNYTWDFGDTSYGYGILTTHIYEKIGVYNVKLTVTDDKDVSNTDSFKVIINQQDNPPTVPQIDGPKTGKQNITYNFTVVSTDPDNDNIQYFFNWGDGKTTETDFLPNNTTTVEKHNWASPGIYNIKIFAIDSYYKSSDSADITILIDVVYCRDIGYFIDENSDEIYDTFCSNDTGYVTDLVYNGLDYLIDTDGDGKENYFFNLENNVLTQIEPQEKDEKLEVENIVLYLIASLLIIILIVIIIIIKRRKSKIEDVKEKQKKEKSSTKKSKINKKEKKPTKKKHTKPSKKKSKTKKKGNKGI